MEKKVRYYLLVTANPLSDSKAAISIFKMIRRLDILSGDITIFLPGFHTNEKLERESLDDVQQNVDSINKKNVEKHEDFHGKDAVYHTYVDTEGDIYFNDADFSNFMLDLEEKSRNFEYVGRVELVVIPSLNGSVLYDELKSFNLEALSDLDNPKIEEFLMRVIKLIQRDTDNHSLQLLEKISETYQSLCTDRAETGYTNVVLRIDDEILHYLHWQDVDEAFFISYSTKDEFQAYALKGLLEKSGKKVWMAPEGIPSGFDYAQAIPAALRITTRFVVLLSSNSAQSTWVRREIGKAISNNKRIDGVFLEGFSMEMLQQYDHLNFLFENVQIKYKIDELFDNNDILDNFLNK